MTTTSETIDQMNDASIVTEDTTGRARNESYGQLVWARFKRSKAAIAGGLMILALLMLALFAEFFSPNDFYSVDSMGDDSYIPPTRIHLFDEEGTFHWWPFVYGQTVDYDPKTYEPLWIDDTSVRYDIEFFVESWEWKVFGLFPTRYHLFDAEGDGRIFIMGTEKQGRDLWGRACLAGRISLSLSLFATFISIAVGAVVGVVSGYYGGWIDNALQRFVEFVASFPQLPLWLALAAIIPRDWDSFRVFIIMAVIFSLLSWTLLAREVRGKVMAFRETDFILAAKEMGASDWRIILLHLFPNSLSHILVVLTLTIPQIILAEAFLSFLGIGITEPLVSWGFLMKEANKLQTLGQNTWIMSPVIFIIVAVLGFNFLGDGLRDAADPYSVV